MKKSFYDWCIENNRIDLLDRWDYELNTKYPEDVGMTSANLYYFKCPVDLHKSTPYKLTNFARHINSDVKCVFCNSFAKWGIDNFGSDFLDKYWDYDKNNDIDPWVLAYKSNTDIYIFCQEKSYHESYNTQPAKFIAGHRCPYCINRKVHPNDSFAAVFPEMVDRWSHNNDKSPFEYSPHSSEKVWFKCPKGIHPDYEQKISNAVDYNFRCKECSLDESRKPNDLVGMTFGRLTVKSLDMESKQTVSKDGYVRYRWWCQCSCGNSKLKSVLGSHLTSGRIQSCGCLKHSECSQLQLKVENYIQDVYGYQINHEYNCDIVAKNPKTGRKLPYDNEVIIPEKRLIIEVMGESHYKIDLYVKKNAARHNNTPEQELEYLQYRDQIKKDYALSQGYHYLEIPYWTESDESYKTLIDDTIHKILNS
jgi:hypothetical protein